MQNVQDSLTALKRGQFKPVYALVGAEQYLKDQFMGHLIDALGGSEGIDRIKFDLHEVDITTILEEAETFSFFADYRLIEVTNATFLNAQSKAKMTDAQQKQLLDYIQGPNEASIVVFHVTNDSLDKRKKLTKQFNKSVSMVDCSPLDETQVTRYVKGYIANLPIQFTKEAIDELLVRVNYQLTQAMVEVDKLMIYAQNVGQVNIDTVRNLVARTLESDVFELSNAIVTNDVKAAVQIYQDLRLMKHEPIALHALLVSQFRLMLQTMILSQQGLNQADIAQQLGVHAFRVKLAYQNSRSISYDKLKGFYVELAEMDYQMKTGIGDKDTFFYILLTKITGMRQRP